jgi:hypothetical protein
MRANACCWRSWVDKSRGCAAKVAMVKVDKESENDRGINRPGDVLLLAFDLIE